MTPKIKVTEDGSTTLFREDLQEHYHSIHGAIQESNHVYIQAGFQQLTNEQSRILEIGFGTGLNALLTCEETSRQKKKIIYHSIEKNFLSKEITKQLDFGKGRAKLLEQLHAIPCDKTVDITPYFCLKKIQADLLDYEFTEQYDLIYYDAFAPDKQPEMWAPNIIKKVSSTLTKGGFVTTYSTKGTVKRAFRELGLEVKRLPGPPGKRDMLRCRKL
ncbi:tRNA U34 5-methylaminomethyl-2-thiouridine-forming methyltransferase MnmC [Balneicella halophila]|uniref:tRNA U34 5-methylaminomethyl-2-thiouridine-forming methyltransferase MnmC n=1 Tax=Balneicella halophila TaxID=1537566 RepID=A0A7L4UNZ4_BALHA|nr:tRNA (5-methylaminomethyl-2-thiouridine)(34)-methyltransferase MnmD [Balneicella halophila]PVX50843.1 tRNA U34 5-methylaminomethyl-2-thiouridine-forming methyltransferase MnmC [Balneicella halophila]